MFLFVIFVSIYRTSFGRSAESCRPRQVLRYPCAILSPQNCLSKPGGGVWWVKSDLACIQRQRIVLFTFLGDISALVPVMGPLSCSNPKRRTILLTETGHLVPRMAQPA